MKSTVVILSTFLSPFRSGAEACAEEVAIRLSEQFDITIVTAKLKSDLPRRDKLQDQVNVVRVGLGCSFDKWLYPFLAPFAVRSLKPNLIHGVLETFAGLALHYCKVLVPKAKQVLTLQTTNRSFLKKTIIQSPDHVTAISSVLKTIAQQHGRDDVTVIPNGIHYSLAQGGAKKEGRVVFVGRLEKMKGIDTLLKAFAEVAKDQLHATLRIVGEGSQRQVLQRLARKLGIADRVTFVGQVPAEKVYEELKAAQVFCGFSRSEALGNVFIEAQAAGCAVIGTNIGGIPDTIADGKTGMLVPVDNVDASSSAMRRLLKDPAYREQLAEAGRENAKKCDWGEIAEQYRKIIDMMIDSHLESRT